MIYWILIIIISTVILWKTSDYLENSIKIISSHYGFPQVIQGAVIAAIGSSFPELSSVILSVLLHNQLEIGLGAIVGSAIFNILVIPSVVVLSSGSLFMNKEVVHKETKFYMVSISTIIIIMSLAVIYNPIESNTYISGNISPILALLPVLLYLVYIFDQWVSFKNSKISSNNLSSSEYSIIKQWAFLILSLIIITICVEALIRSVIYFGNIFNTPSLLWSVTIISISTSLPDMFISIKQANNKDNIASISNVLGSNTFDLLVALPLGIIIVGGISINFSASVPLLSSLVIATILFFIVMRKDMNIGRIGSLLLFSYYILFILWIILESFNIINTIPS
jgi:cation:H+ antiporter